MAMAHEKGETEGQGPPGIPVAEKFAAGEYRDRAGRWMGYRLLAPRAIESAQRYPVVLFLHGAGERGSDNAAQLANGVGEWLGSDEAQERYPTFYLVPQCPEGQYWAAPGRELSEAAQLAMGTLWSVLEHHPIHRSRIYLGGLSMGAFGAWDLLLRYPTLFAAAISICGGANPDWVRRLRNVPVWLFHGALDDVVPPEASRAVVATLEKADGKVRYTEYPDVGHASWVPAFQEPELREWLFAQRNPHVEE